MQKTRCATCWKVPCEIKNCESARKISTFSEDEKTNPVSNQKKDGLKLLKSSLQKSKKQKHKEHFNVFIWHLAPIAHFVRLEFYSSSFLIGVGIFDDMIAEAAMGRMYVIGKHSISTAMAAAGFLIM